MERHQTTAVDQALFGYSDGHRQLACSIRLSSRDSYELATRSDLAPGAQLDPQASYIAGFSLPESRIFAFVKTWLAPEMPRPGCVWSHVLLLPKSFLSVQVDLGILQSLFVRPTEILAREDYSKKLQVKRLAKAMPARPSLVAQILIAYYESLELSVDSLPDEGLDRAILAVWSQQWPKLRSEFEFRTILTSESVDRGLRIRLGSKRRLDSDYPDHRDWLMPAVEDAVATTVTPLRRFLWRYGKDIERPRQAFVELVKFYQDSELKGDGISFERVLQLLKKLPGNRNALTLKRDFLGASSAAPSYVPKIGPYDFVRTVLVLKPIENKIITANELSEIVSTFAQRHYPEVMRALRDCKEGDGVDHRAVEDVLVQNVSAGTLSTLGVPVSFIMDVLSVRPELILDLDLDLFDLSSVEALLEFAVDDATRQKLLERLLSEAPRRRTGLVVERGEFALRVAVHLSILGTLHIGWREIFPGFAEKFLKDGLSDVSGLQNISHAIQLLDFPVYRTLTASHWASASRRKGKKGDSEDRVVVDAFLLALCLVEGISKNIGLIAEVLPRLRRVALMNALSDRVSQLLERHLPDVYNSWDINKRLLKVLRQATQEGVDIQVIINSMPMTDEEIAYSLGSDEAPSFDLSKLFWRW